MGKTVYEWEQVNTQKAIWLRSKEDVTEEEYNEFYKGISKDYLYPLAYTHCNAEGEIEFKSILFLPKKAPFDMMDNYWTKKSEVKLFVRGVVDSDDLPLNVSREQLQQNKIMKVISKKLVRKVLELMKKLAKEEDSGEDDEDEEKEDGEEKEEKDDKEEKKDRKRLKRRTKMKRAMIRRIRRKKTRRRRSSDDPSFSVSPILASQRFCMGVRAVYGNMARKLGHLCGVLAGRFVFVPGLVAFAASSLVQSLGATLGPRLPHILYILEVVCSIPQ